MNHATVTVMVNVDVDARIARLVVALNKIPAIRTLASCEATGTAYEPYVMLSWIEQSGAESLDDLISAWNALNIKEVGVGGRPSSVSLDDYWPRANTAHLRVDSAVLDAFASFAENFKSAEVQS